MKTFKYISDKIDIKTIKRKRLEIFDNFIYGRITYDEYVEQGKKLSRNIWDEDKEHQAGNDWKDSKLSGYK